MTLLSGLAAVTLLATGAPSWAALLVGMGLALVSGRPAPAALRTWTPRVLQLAVVALGAGMDLDTVLRVGASGALLTAASLVAALVAAAWLGRWLGVEKDAAILLGVGTAICGGSAIAAVAGVLRPKPEHSSVALGVVFLLNAVGLLLFPPLGHALGLDEPAFGRWAALAIHDTSSVVGAGLAYGPTALEVATTTKLVRALWIVPVTLGLALVERREGMGSIKWPWFILGFVGAAALFSWLPALAPLAGAVQGLGKRAMVLALFLIGLSLSRETLRKVGLRPLALGVVLWILLGLLALPLARAPGLGG